MISSSFRLHWIWCCYCLIQTTYGHVARLFIVHFSIIIWIAGCWRISLPMSPVAASLYFTSHGISMPTTILAHLALSFTSAAHKKFFVISDKIVLTCTLSIIPVSPISHVHFLSNSIWIFTSTIFTKSALWLINWAANSWWIYYRGKLICWTLILILKPISPISFFKASSLINWIVSTTTLAHSTSLEYILFYPFIESF